MFIFKWVRSIKSGENTENKKIIWYTTSSWESLKAILPNFSITIVSFQEVSETPSLNLYEFWIEYEGNFVNIIISIDWKIRDAFKSFIEDFWIKDISYVKPYWTDISKEKQNIILSKLKEELWKGKKVNKETKTKTPDINKLESSNKKQLEDFKKEVNEFIKEINAFIPEAKDIYPNLTLELENAIWNLLKYRSTTNIFKIANHYKKALEISEKLYNKYYDHKKKEDKDKISNNVISNIDIIREYKQYEKVQRAKTIESVDSKEFKFPWYEVIYYKIFWKYWVNLKLLVKELTEKYKLNYFWFIDILKFIQFIILFLIIEYSLFLVYKLFIVAPESEILSIYYMLLNISILWFIITLGKMFTKKIWTFISIILMIILYLIFSYFKTFFGF